jgi:hypothetical protein
VRPSIPRRSIRLCADRLKWRRHFRCHKFCSRGETIADPEDAFSRYFEGTPQGFEFISGSTISYEPINVLAEKHLHTTTISLTITFNPTANLRAATSFTGIFGSLAEYRMSVRRICGSIQPSDKSAGTIKEIPMSVIRQSLLATICLTAGVMLAPLTSLASETLPSEAPPPNQVEPIPAPQIGQVWDAGHWEWNGTTYWWRRGAWRDARPGSHWVADRWEQVGTEWHRVPGHWEH